MTRVRRPVAASAAAAFVAVVGLALAASAENAPDPAQPTAERSVLTRWWFWAAVGGVVAGSIALLVASQGSSAAPTPVTDYGSFQGLRR